MDLLASYLVLPGTLPQTLLEELLRRIARMISNEMTPTSTDNLYSLATHHANNASKETNISTIGQVQVQTEQAVLPIENEKGSQMNVVA